MAKQKISEDDFQQSVDSQVSDALVKKVISTSSELPLSPSIQSTSIPQDEKPTITLNTRIPQSLSEKIDDHIYLSRKKGKPETKQSLTIKALAKLLEP